LGSHRASDYAISAWAESGRTAKLRSLSLVAETAGDVTQSFGPEGALALARAELVRSRR
jgi:hypothetical protein